MRLCHFFIIGFFLCFALDAFAQMPEEQQQITSMPDQWQLTLDVIKSRAQTLMLENNGLQSEYQQLLEKAQQIQRAIARQQSRNELASRFLRTRHGFTDQQIRIDELTQGIKTKKEEARGLDDQLTNFQRRKSNLDRKVQQLKRTVSSFELHQQAEKEKVQTPQITSPVQTGDDLDQWRKQLEDETKQEVLLENELETLKTGSKVQNVDVDTVESQNKQLEARLDVLRLQKLKQNQKSSDTKQVQAKGRLFDK